MNFFGWLLFGNFRDLQEVEEQRRKEENWAVYWDCSSLVNCLPRACRGERAVDVAGHNNRGKSVGQRPIRKNYPQPDASSSTPRLDSQSPPHEEIYPDDDTDSSVPSPPQPKKGRGIAKGLKMPEDPSKKLSIRWDEGRLHPEIRKNFVIILKENICDAYTGWALVSFEHKEVYWEAFRQKYEWDPAQEHAVHTTFMEVCRNRYNHAMIDIQTSCRKKNFIEKKDYMSDEV